MSQNKKPLISVIMGVYNDKDYLNLSIESILNQSYKNFEFIICNDCSTDLEITTILNQYASIDDRIIIINNESNCGLATSLNNCLKIAKGKYIARMDSDDISLPNRFEAEVDFLENNPTVSVCGGQIYYIDKNNFRYKKSHIYENILIDFNYAVKNTCLAHPTTMIKKDDLLSVGGYTVNKNTLRAEDYDLWCKLTYNGYKLVNLTDILLEYREDMEGFKKRKYKYRIQESALKFNWLKKSNLPITKYYYAIRPLIVGLIPNKIMKKIKYKKI